MTDPFALPLQPPLPLLALSAIHIPVAGRMALRGQPIAQLCNCEAFALIEPETIGGAA